MELRFAKYTQPAGLELLGLSDLREQETEGWGGGACPTRPHGKGVRPACQNPVLQREPRGLDIPGEV